MQREGRSHSPPLFDRPPDPRPDPAGSVAMSLSDAHDMLCQWGAAEWAEIRRVWYPAHACGYDDYEPPRDPDTRQDREIRRAERDDALIDRVGWCVMAVGAPHTQILRQCYVAEYIQSHKRRNAAIRAFGRTFAIWSERLDGPMNPL